MSRIRAVVDRFEGKAAVLLIEDGRERIVIPAKLLPDNCKEGSVLDIVFEVEVNEEATEAIKREIQDLIDELSGEEK